jgi:radical SAM modification target selenobiotic family peptide
MNTRELKTFLAGLGIAGLLAGTTLMAGGCAKWGKGS